MKTLNEIIPSLKFLFAGPQTITLVQNHEKYQQMSALKDTDEILIIKKK